MNLLLQGRNELPKDRKAVFCVCVTDDCLFCNFLKHVCWRMADWMDHWLNLIRTLVKKDSWKNTAHPHIEKGGKYYKNCCFVCWWIKCYHRYSGLFTAIIINIFNSHCAFHLKGPPDGLQMTYMDGSTQHWTCSSKSCLTIYIGTWQCKVENVLYPPTRICRVCLGGQNSHLAKSWAAKHEESGRIRYGVTDTVW